MDAQPCLVDGLDLPTGEDIDVVDPSTGEVFARVARGGAGQVDAAGTAAREAADVWRSRSTEQRSAVQRRTADLIRRDREELAPLESTDTGKPLTRARADTDVAARYFEYYANVVEAFFGHTLPDLEGFVAYTRHEPYGVTGHIIPNVRAGQVYVNTYGAGGGVELPFGGCKKSGYGREKGFDALAGLCQTKTVVMKVPR